MLNYHRKLFLTVIFCFILTNLVFAESKTLFISAEAAIVVEKKSNRILYAKNHRLELPMASTSKVMTALLALENLNLESNTKIGYQASQAKASKAHLREGEEWKNINLLYALLMNSANDAAVSLAEEISGSEVAFSQLMNKRAGQLNMKKTNFANSTGLPREGQFSTCFDLIKVWKKASLFPVFTEIMCRKNKIITSNSGRNISLKNHNKLLWKYHHSFMGKTGYTLKAKHCFVGELKVGKKSFIIAILGSRSLWQDLTTLADLCQRRK